MSVLSGPSKLEFIPWDFNSEDHRQRAYLQRVACGWRSTDIPEWVEKCKEGEMMVYWLVLSDTVPDRDAQIAAHIAKYPKESAPITDTAPQSWLSHPRTPTNRPVNPIGHVGLVIPPPAEISRLYPPTQAVVAYIGKLYVSYALQSYGYGGATMRAVEALARDRLGAEVCVLDTMSRHYQMRPDVLEAVYVRHGNPVPKISNEQWYIKMGYEMFHQDEKGYKFTNHDTGEQEYCPICYFRKTLK